MRGVFGDAVDVSQVQVRRRRWWWLQPRSTTMAPSGHLHFHPDSGNYCEDFSTAAPRQQAHFIHEMTHVWQSQRRGWWYLPLVGPFQRKYSYKLKPGKKLTDYNIEQQAEIVAHAFMLSRGWTATGGTGETGLLEALPDHFALRRKA